jgi:hypothetical protein
MHILYLNSEHVICFIIRKSTEYIQKYFRKEASDLQTPNFQQALMSTTIVHENRSYGP